MFTSGEQFLNPSKSGNGRRFYLKSIEENVILLGGILVNFGITVIFGKYSQYLRRKETVFFGRRSTSSKVVGKAKNKESRESFVGYFLS